MNGLVAGLQVAPPIEGGSSVAVRLLLTVTALAALVVAGWLALLASRRVDGEIRSRVLNAGLAVGWLGLATGIGLAISALWQVPIFDVVKNPVSITARAVVTITLLLGTYLLTGPAKRLVFEFTEDLSAITTHQTELSFRLLQVAMYVLAIMVAFSVWDVNLGGLLVGAGFLGIVVGLAARQTLGSVIAGFVLMFARPFEIGDWVQIGDREGIVSEISIVNTSIQTFDGEYVLLPNDQVGSNEVVNRARKGRLRIEVEVGVDYDADLEHAMAVADEAVRSVDEALTAPQPKVVCKAFGDSSVVLGLRFWIDKPSAQRRWRARTAVITAVKEAYDREGITIPFPQRELSSRGDGAGIGAANLDRVDTGPAPDGGRGARNDDGGNDA